MILTTQLLANPPKDRHPPAERSFKKRTQPRQVRNARRVCSVGGRPILHRAKSARAARHGIRTQWPRPFEACAADLSRYWCGRAPADGVGRSAPRVGPQHNHAKSALRGACSVSGRPILHGAKRARAARHGILTRVISFRNACLPTCRGVGAVEPPPTAEGGAPCVGHNTTTPSPHCAARAPWAVGRYSTMR